MNDGLTFTSTINKNDSGVTKAISVRCYDGAEMVTFMQHKYKTLGTNYEFVFEDSYCGGYYRGIWGRLMRAWHAFWGKPICYTGLYFEGTPRIRKFLIDCLALVDEQD